MDRFLLALQTTPENQLTETGKMSHSHKEDIRGQLSDIQKKLFGNSKEKSNTPLQLPDATQGARQPPGLIGSSSAVPRLTQKSSSSHLGKLSNSNKQNTLVPQPAPALGPESKGHDMNFVVGLSENLLTECRRLTAENSKYKTKLKSVGEQLDKYKNQVVSLTNSRSFAASNEEQLKDKNWELEAANTQLNEELEKLRITNDKLVKLTTESTLRIASVQKENDELRLQHNTLDTDLHKSRDTYEKELAELNSRISLLNDENDALHVKLSEKSKEPSAAPPAEKKTVFHDTTALEDLEPADLDSILTASESLTKDLGSGSSNELRVETLKANLDHAHRMVAKLRGALLKMRFENQSPQSRETPRSSKKSKQRDIFPLPSNRSSNVYSPAKRNSKFLVLEDDSGESWPQDEKWEDFIESGSATPSKAVRQLPNWDEDSPQKAQTDVPALDSESSDSETESVEHVKRDIRLELTNVAELTDKQVQDYAKEHHMVLIAQDDFAKLQYNDIEGISDERLKGASEVRGFVFLSKEEYNELVDESEMKSRLQQRGFVTIPTQEYESITKDAASYLSPDTDYLTSQLEKQGLAAVETEYLDILKKNEEIVAHPSESYLRSKCKEAQLHPLSHEEFKSFKKIEADFAKPDKKYLTEKANDLGMILTSTAFYDDLVERANEPTAEHIIEHGSKRNLHVLSNEQFNALQNPLLDDWKSRAASFGHNVIPLEDYSRLHELAHEPTLDTLKSHVVKHDHKLLPSADFEKLSDLANSPSLPHLEEKAKYLDHSIIPTLDLENLKRQIESPSIEYIKEKAAGHKVVDNDQYKSLLQKVHEPSLAQVQAHAEKHDLVTLDKNEYTNLYKSFHEPTLEFIKLKANEKGLLLHKSDELQRLQDLELSPSHEFILSRAKNTGHTVLKDSEHDSLKRLAHNPPVEHLQSFLAGFGLSSIETPELESLHKKAHEPTIEELNSKALTFDSVIIKKNEYEELKNLSENPTIEHLKNKASQLGFEVCSALDLEELETRAEEPSLEVVERQAASFEMLVILNSELEKLRNDAQDPDISLLEKHVKRKDYSLLPVADLTDIKRRAQNPTLDELKEHAKGLNHAVLSEAEFNQLKKDIDEPEFEYLEKHVSKFDHVLVPSSDHKALLESSEKPSLEKITERAEELQFEVVKKSDFETLQRDATEPPIDLIRKHAAVHSLEVVPKDDLSLMRKTVDEPDLDFIHKHAPRLDHKLISLEEFEALKNAAEKPSFATIEKQAAVSDHRLIKSEELATLKKAASDPSEELLSSHAKKLGFLLVGSTAHEELTRRATAPTEDEVRAFAEEKGFTLKDKTELNDLQRQLDTPSKRYLEEKAKQLGFGMIAHEELENPSTEYLESKAANKQMLLVSNELLSTLQLLAHSPSLDHITSHAAKQDHVVVKKSEYDEVVKEAREPTSSSLSLKATALGLSTIPLFELNSLKKNSENPDLSWIKKAAEKNGYAVTKKDELTNLQTLAHKPSIEHMLKLAQDRNRTLVENEYLENLQRRVQRPTLDETKKCVETHDGEFVSKVEAEKLRKMANSPDIDLIRQHAIKHDHVVISKSEHADFTSPSVQKLEEFAKTLNVSVLPIDEHEKMRQLAFEPQVKDISEMALKHGHSVVPTQIYESIQSKANSPDIDHIKGCAAALDYATIKKPDYKRLLELASRPDEEHMRKQAARLQMDLISKEELTSLRNAYFPDMESLKDGISKHGMVAVPTLEFEKHLEDKERLNTMKLVTHEEYNNLVSISKEPSLTFLEEKAGATGRTLITRDELERLQHNDEEPDLEFLKNHAESHGHTLVDDKEYSRLKDISDSPSIEFLSSKVEVAGYKLLTQDDYDGMVKLIESPSNDYLRQKASLKQLTIISNDELSKLKSQLEEPGTEYLFQKAEQKSFKLLSKAEYQKLIDAIENPTSDYLEKKCQVRGQSLIATEELASLNQPSIEALSKHARSHDHVLLNQAEYDELNRKVGKPSLDEVTLYASSLGSVIISADEYDVLKEHKAKSLDVLARESGFQLVEEAEHKKLLESANNPPIEKIQEHATSRGFVALPVGEHSLLLDQVKSPKLEYLQTNASTFKHRVVSDESYNELTEPLSVKLEKAGLIGLTKAEHDELKEPSLERIKEMSSVNGSVIVPSADYEELARSLESKLAEAGLVGVPLAEHQKMIDSAESPSVDKIREVASKQDHHVIPISEYNELSKDLQLKAEEQGMVLTPIEEFKALKSKVESPTADFITKAALSAGMVAVAKDHFDSVTTKANRSIEDQAKEQNLTLLPQTEHGELLSSKQKCEELSQTVSDLQSKYDSPSIEYLDRSAAANKRVLIEESEYEKLKSLHETSIFDKAAALSMVAVLSAEFGRLKKRSDESFEEHASREGLTAISPSELNKLKESSEKPSIEKAKAVIESQDMKILSTADHDDLKRRATRTIDSLAEEAGMILITKEEHERSVKEINEPSEDFVRTKAHALGLQCVTGEELENLKSEASLSAHDKAKLAGLAAIGIAELEDLRNRPQILTVDDLRQIAESHDSVVVPKNDLEDWKTKANRTLEEQLEGTDKLLVNTLEYNALLLQATKPSVDHLQLNAEKKGLSVIPSDELDALKKLSEESAEEKAAKQNLVVISKERLDELETSVNEPGRDHLTSKCAALGLSVVLATELLDLQNKASFDHEKQIEQDGKVIIERDQLASLQAAAERKFTTAEATALLSQEGYRVLTEEEVNSEISRAIDLQKPSEPTNKEAIAALEAKGYLVSKGDEEFRDANDSFALDATELNCSAGKLDKVVVDRNEYEQMVEDAKAVNDKERLIKAGALLGLSVLGSGELLKLKQTLAEKDSKIHDLSGKVDSKLSKEDLMRELEGHGLFMLPQAEYTGLKDRIASLEAHQDNVLTEEEITKRANDLGLSVVSTTELHRMKRSLMIENDAGQVKQAAKKLGMICVPLSAVVTGSAASNVDSEPVTVLPTSQYNNLRNSSIDTIPDETFKTYAEKRGFRHESTMRMSPLNEDIQDFQGSPSSARQVSPRIPQSQSVGSNLTIHSRASMLDSITGMSVASNISLTDKSMIPVITQVLIGEYLFKYYRKLGPLSSISSTRHERYFWVHPYSLTLYWSTSNPVLKNPNSSKSKAIAILGVESVEDNNPLPVGLYHKSIIVHSQTKSVKFTCSNRQRHNIWFNSLRYLVHRNINELDFGGHHHQKREAPEADQSDDENDDLPDMTFDASNRQALPRSSTILRSSSLGRFMSLKK